jgi:antitoxin CcdA
VGGKDGAVVGKPNQSCLSSLLLYPRHVRDYALIQALKAAGGVSKLAHALGLDHSTVSGWTQLPPRHVGAVSAVTGMTPHQLRPDLFQPAQVGVAGFPEAKAHVPEATPRSLHAEATALGLDPNAIAEKALREAIREEKARRWLEENREAIAAHNRWVEENGLPLAEYRMF